MSQNVFPTEFFSVNHPGAPVVNIQFRTKVVEGASIDDPNVWESITFNPNNFFENMTLEDSGGVIDINLSLFDKNFTKLENTIVRSMTATRLANKLVNQPDYAKDDSGLFQFYVSKKSSVQLRVRFGYSQSYVLTEEYVNTVDFSSSEWKEREENIPVIKSPWLYFTITGIDFSFKNEGLQASIKGMSTMQSFLRKAKMLKKFAKLRGTPQNILADIETTLNDAAQASSGGEENVEFVLRDKPIGPKNRDGKETIEIMLGSEANRPRRDEATGEMKYEPSYKNLKQVIDEICNKVQPKLFDENNQEIPPSSDTGAEAEGERENNENTANTAAYNYYVEEEGKTTRIVFYYEDPFKSSRNQGMIRTYPWLEHGQSIVTSMEIKSNTDFAQLNLQVATVDADTGEVSINVARGKEESEEDEEGDVNFTVGNIKDVSAALEDENFNASFVSDVRDSTQFQATGDTLSPKQASTLIARQIVKNLNKQVFEGSIEIPGDPFFLFGPKMQPFSYLIRIVVKRPNYVNENGEWVDGGKSYISGLYGIKKIKHDISAGNFSTTLEAMKYPGIENTNT